MIDLSRAARDVLAERRRHIDMEGFDAAHRRRMERLGFDDFEIDAHIYALKH